MNSMSGEKLKGVPYTGTLPAVLAGTKAGYLHRYKIYGNTEQTGTPTPENPIVPSECGEKTENLIHALENGTKTGLGLTATIKKNSSEFILSSVTYSSDRSLSIETDVTIPAGTYTIAVDGLIYYLGAGTDRLYLRKNDTSVIINSVYTGLPRTFTISETTNIDRFVIICNKNSEYNNQTVRVWLLRGSYTAQNLPEYIPYGYKLPLLSGSTPVDIYISESQITRRIKKLVFDGTEDWKYSTRSQAHYVENVPSDYDNTLYLQITALCTHYRGVRSNTDFAGMVNGDLRLYAKETAPVAHELYIKDETYTSAADFKTYLQQQYANGTPVTVWYVLATEETGTLNEPLRKIGDYADTIESTQTSAQIPTTANSTTISWGGQGLAPSEFDSIQEWVDIPTYKRVNGAWVADNSN